MKAALPEQLSWPRGLLGHAAGDEPSRRAPDLGLRDPGMRTLLAHRFMEQLIDRQRLQFAALDVPSSPSANGLGRFPNQRTIHKDLLRRKPISDPRSNQLDG